MEEIAQDMWNRDQWLMVELERCPVCPVHDSTAGHNLAGIKSQLISHKRGTEQSSRPNMNYETSGKRDARYHFMESRLTSLACFSSFSWQWVAHKADGALIALCGVSEFCRTAEIAL